MKIAILAALLSVSVVLAACGGGGGGGSGLSDAERVRIGSDPRVVRLRGIAGRADSLLISSVRSHYSISAQGTTVSDSLVEAVRCSGTRCVSDSGESITLADLLLPDTGGRVESVRLGSRGGLDTAEVRGGFAVSYREQGGTITYDSSASAYGLWGEYGFAQVALGDGPISGSISGVSVGGTARIAVAAVFGDASGTNPAGLGSATWRGIAEAVSANTYRHRQGTVAVTTPICRDRASASMFASAARRSGRPGGPTCRSFAAATAPDRSAGITCEATSTAPATPRPTASSTPEPMSARSGRSGGRGLRAGS